MPRDPSVATGRLMSRDWRYHSAWPPPADVEGAAEAAAGVRVPSPVAYASPRGLLPLEPLVAACRAVGGLAWDAVVAARAAVGLGPRSAPVSGGAGCGNPEVDPAAAAAAASSASPGHGRMDVRGEKQAGPLPVSPVRRGRGSGPGRWQGPPALTAASVVFTRPQPSNTQPPLQGAGSHPKAECDSHAQTVTPRGAGLKPSPPAPPAKAGAGARRGLHTPAGGAGGGRRGGSVGGAALPEPESVGGMIGAAEALLAERDADERSARHTLSGGVGARTRNGDVGAAVAAAATVADADVPLVGPTAADEDYARLGTKSAPRDARLGDVHVLPGAGGRPAVLARSDGIEEGMLEARVAHIHLAFRDEDALAGAHEVKAPGKGGGGKGLRHARRRGRGPVTVVDDAAALDAAVGLGLAPEDAADRWDLEPTQPEAAALAHDPWTADETTAASTDRAKAGTALWQQQQQRAASTTTTGASGAGGEPLPAPPRDWEEDALPPGAPVSSAAGWGVPPEYDPDAVDAPARVAGRAAASAAATYAAGAMRGSGSGATAMSDERHIDYVETGGGVARPEASASGYADLERPGEDTEAAASYTGTTVRPGADRPSVPQQPR